MPVVLTKCIRLSPDIVWNFVKQALSLLQPPAQRLDEALIALPAFDLRRGLCVARQRRRDGQPEADEQRERFGRYADIALEPLDLPGQPIETAGEGGLAPIRAVRRQEGGDGRLHNRRAREPLSVGEIDDLLRIPAPKAVLREAAFVEGLALRLVSGL